MIPYRKLLLCIGLVALLASTNVTACAGQKFLMSIEGTSQGKFKSESTVRGHEGWITANSVSIGDMELNEANHSAISKTFMTGKRQHGPFKIVREVDAASPRLLLPLVSNESFKTATIDVIDIPQGSKAEPRVLHHLVITNGTYSIKPDGPGKQMIIFVGGDATYQ